MKSIAVHPTTELRGNCAKRYSLWPRFGGFPYVAFYVQQVINCSQACSTTVFDEKQ
jgi:hypothetical protein